jgi:cytochrome P450
VFRARFVGVPHLVYVATPALAERVLCTDRDIGQAGTARKDFLEPLVGPESVLCLEGEPWRRERRRLAAAFHGQRLGSLTDTMADIVAAEVKTWPVGEPFALRPRMQRITLEVISSVVFGAARGNGRCHERESGRVRCSATAARAVAGTARRRRVPRARARPAAAGGVVAAVTGGSAAAS